MIKNKLKNLRISLRGLKKETVMNLIIGFGFNPIKLLHNETKKFFKQKKQKPNKQLNKIKPKKLKVNLKEVNLNEFDYLK